MNPSPRRIAYPVAPPVGHVPAPAPFAGPTLEDAVDALWDLALAVAGSSAAGDPLVAPACRRAVELLDRCCAADLRGRR